MKKLWKFAGFIALAIVTLGASFPYVTLNNKTNRLSDNGTVFTRNGVAIGGGGIIGTVSNNVASAGLLAVDATKTNGIAATAAHITNAWGIFDGNAAKAVSGAGTLVSLPTDTTANWTASGPTNQTSAGTASAYSLVSTTSVSAASASISELLVGAMSVSRGTLTHGANVTIDFSSTNRYWSCSLTGNVTFVFANVAAGKWANILLRMPATNCTPTFPMSASTTNWLGGAPSTLTGNTIGFLSFYPIDATTNSTIAAYAETQ